MTKDEGFSNTGLKMEVLSGISTAILAALVLGFLLKLNDLMENGKLVYLTKLTQESVLFYLEIIIGTIIPIYCWVSEIIETIRNGFLLLQFLYYQVSY